MLVLPVKKKWFDMILKENKELKYTKWFVAILDKMQELEQGSDSNE